MKVEYIKKEDCFLFGDTPVKVTTCGNIIETKTFEKVNRKGSSIINLGGYKYCLPSDMDSETGEIKEDAIKDFNRTENRAQNSYGLAKSMKTVRDLINCNITDSSCVRWVTLTYAENMTDTERLYEDRKNFWKRYKYFCKKNKQPFPEYISIVEPQGRGAWHLHELWIYENKAPFLPNELIAELWGQGFVTVKKVDDVDNVGAYLTAYLCDIPIDEAGDLNLRGFKIKEADVKKEDGTIERKKYVKGGRLHLYPNKMNFYRTSRGIKRPDVEWLPPKEAKEKVKDATLTYTKAIRLTDEDTDFKSDILYEYYNTVRGKKQDSEPLR